MNEPIHSIDKIRAQAQAAARKCEPPLQACTYPFGSAGGRLWMLEYTKEVNRQAALLRRQHQPQGDEHAG